MPLYAADGSYNVTVTAGSSMEVSTTAPGPGLYAPDGSYRVTVVAGGSGQPELVDGSQDWNGQPILIANNSLSATQSATIDLHDAPGILVLVLLPNFALVGDGSVTSDGYTLHVTSDGHTITVTPP